MLDNSTYMFKKRENVAEIEEGKLLSPKFNNDGLIPVITTCSKTKEILMHGYMNVEACLLYTSPSPRDRQKSRMPSSA